MTFFLLKYRNIFIFILCSFAFTIVLLVAIYILSFTSKVDLEESSANECRFQLFSETSYPFEVQFAVIVIMFLLFDIEVLYLFPLVVSSLYSMLFLFPLVSSLSSFLSIEIFFILGLFHIISRKVLDSSLKPLNLTLFKSKNVPQKEISIRESLSKKSEKIL